MKRAGIIALVVGVIAILRVIAPASAANTVCTGPITGQTITGNVTVPPGAVCSLASTTVTGSVTVGAGADLSVLRSTIGGSLTATDATVNVNQSSTVKGQVVLTRPRSGAGGGTAAGLCDSTFGASITVRSAVMPTTTTSSTTTTSTTQDTLGLRALQLPAVILIGTPTCLNGNRITSNVSILNNFADRIEVGGNTIGGNLICSGNSVVPAVENNTVTGKVVDQCLPQDPIP